MPLVRLDSQGIKMASGGEEGSWEVGGFHYLVTETPGVYRKKDRLEIDRSRYPDMKLLSFSSGGISPRLAVPDHASR